MGKLISEDVKTSLRIMTKSLTHYVESNDFKHILEIENYLKEFFVAQSVKFWFYDEKNQVLTPLDNENSKPIPLDSSLTKQVITTMSSILDNHITSNKYYVQSIDNPLNVKLKSLLVFPIVKANKVIGVLRVFRGLKERKSFIKKDETTLETFLPLLLDIMAYKTIDKEKIVQILNENDKNKSTKIRVKKDTIKKSISHASTKVDKDTQELQQIKETLALLEKEKSDDMNGLIEEVKSYKDNDVILNNNIEDIKVELEESKVKYEQLESSSLELYTESQEYKKQIDTLTKHIELLNSENKALKNDVKEAKESGSSQSIKDLKSAQSLSLQQKSSNIDDNMECILQYVDNSFADNEYTYILFELIVYALYSKKGIAYIEESIRKSKLVPYIIDGYYFKGDLEVHNEKRRISDLVKHIERYEKNIFSNVFKLKVTIDKKMPVSLVFDTIKIQSVILHLLTDLYQFADHTKEINVNLLFKKKFLNIEIGGSIHQKNSLFKSMFKQTKLGGDEKDRMGLQLSKKIAERLKGEINYIYEEEYYKFIFTVPAQVIKM